MALSLVTVPRDTPPNERRLLVIGATGQVGAAVADVATKSRAFESVIRASRTVNEPAHRIDLADESSVLGLLGQPNRPTWSLLLRRLMSPGVSNTQTSRGG